MQVQIGSLTFLLSQLVDLKTLLKLYKTILKITFSDKNATQHPIN